MPQGLLQSPRIPEGARALVVDDHRAIAELLCGALESAGMHPVGTAHSAAQGISMAEQLHPDVVVMDIEMLRQDWLAATRRIREVCPDAVVAVVTAHRDPEWVMQAAQAGASAFVPKDGSLSEMLDVLRNVHAGQMLVAPTAFGNAAGPSSSSPASRVPVPQLTRREQEVLDYLGQGMQVKRIARVLGITLETCRGYVKALHAKLGARSQLEAVVKAQRLGLLDRRDASGHQGTPRGQHWSSDTCPRRDARSGAVGCTAAP